MDLLSWEQICHQEIAVQTNLGCHQQGKSWIDCGLSHFVLKMSGQSECSCSPWKGDGEINKLNTLPNEGTVFSKVKFFVLELGIPVPDILAMLS